MSNIFRVYLLYEEEYSRGLRLFTKNACYHGTMNNFGMSAELTYSTTVLRLNKQYDGVLKASKLEKHHCSFDTTAAAPAQTSDMRYVKRVLIAYSITRKSCFQEHPQSCILCFF